MLAVARPKNLYKRADLFDVRRSHSTFQHAYSVAARSAFARASVTISVMSFMAFHHVIEFTS